MLRFTISMTLLLLISVQSASADVYLVYTGEWVQGLRQHLPTKIFRLAEPPPPEQPHFVDVQSVAMPGIDFWHEVRVIPEHRLVMVAIRTPDGRIHSVVTIPMDELSTQYKVSWDDARIVTTIRSIFAEAGEPLLEIRFIEGQPKIFSIKTGEAAVGISSDTIPPTSSQITGWNSLYQRVNLDGNRRFFGTHVYTIVPLPQEGVPDQIELMEAKGWSVLAADPEYLAFAAWRLRPNQQEHQILVRRADNGAWKSYMVHGGETRIQVVNGWLVAVEKEMDPRTVPGQGSYPGIPTGNVVAINPMTGVHIVLPLGENSDILLIEGEQIIFRRGSKLYRATIRPEGIADERLIMEDSRILYVQSAFTAAAD